MRWFSLLMVAAFLAGSPSLAQTENPPGTEAENPPGAQPHKRPARPPGVMVIMQNMSADARAIAEELAKTDGRHAELLKRLDALEAALASLKMPKRAAFEATVNRIGCTSEGECKEKAGQACSAFGYPQGTPIDATQAAGSTGFDKAICFD